MVKTNVSSGCSDSRVFIHASEWYYYFKSLLNDPNAAPLSFQENTEYASPEADVLNSEILPSEISSAIKNCQMAKALESMVYRLNFIKIHCMIFYQFYINCLTPFFLREIFPLHGRNQLSVRFLNQVVKEIQRITAEYL